MVKWREKGNFRVVTVTEFTGKRLVIALREFSGKIARNRKGVLSWVLKSGKLNVRYVWTINTTEQSKRGFL